MVEGYTLNSTVTPYAIPLHVVAAWPPQNENNPERRTWLVPFASCLLLLSTLILSIRIYSRIIGFAGRFGGDDVLIGIAWVSNQTVKMMLKV
jgi:hypothetical protein